MQSMECDNEDGLLSTPCNHIIHIKKIIFFFRPSERRSASSCIKAASSSPHQRSASIAKLVIEELAQREATTSRHCAPGLSLTSLQLITLSAVRAVLTCRMDADTHMRPVGLARTPCDPMWSARSSDTRSGLWNTILLYPADAGLGYEGRIAESSARSSDTRSRSLSR